MPLSRRFHVRANILYSAFVSLEISFFNLPASLKLATESCRRKTVKWSFQIFLDAEDEDELFLILLCTYSFTFLSTALRNPRTDLRFQCSQSYEVNVPSARRNRDRREFIGWYTRIRLFPFIYLFTGEGGVRVKNRPR